MMPLSFSLTGRTLSDTSWPTANRRSNVMLAHAYHSSSNSAWPPVMVAIALGLMLGIGFLPIQLSAAPAADSVKIPAPNPPVLTQAKHLIDKGNPESAATILRQFLTTTPPP